MVANRIREMRPSGAFGSAALTAKAAAVFGRRGS